jgi:hypothetical protein
MGQAKIRKKNGNSKPKKSMMPRHTAPLQFYQENLDEVIAEHRSTCKDTNCKDNFTFTETVATESDYGLVAGVNKSRPREISLRKLPIIGGTVVTVLHLAEDLPEDMFGPCVHCHGEGTEEMDLIPPCHNVGVALGASDGGKIGLVCALKTCLKMVLIVTLAQMKDRNRRWGIVQTEGDIHVQLIDRKRALRDGHNHIAVSESLIDWLDPQPETRIPGVMEMLIVHITSHKTGISGGVGSVRHEIALAAWEREKAAMSPQQILKAELACIDLFARGKKQWPDSKFTLPPEPAATPEEVKRFHEEQKRKEANDAVA